MKIQRQISLNVSGLHVREAGTEGEESRVIEGHAVVFGQRSLNLVPWSSWREVYEIMEPGCITQELLDNSDVVLTAFHDNTKIMGRSVNGKGTLKLSIDGVGVLVRCELAKTNDADDMLELIRRGDISGMSFCYTANEKDSENGVSYEKTNEQGADGKEVWLRHVKKCNGVYDVTIAGRPAYQGTDISNREVGEKIEKAIETPIIEAQKQEREAQRKRENMQRELRNFLMEAE